MRGFRAFRCDATVANVLRIIAVGMSAVSTQNHLPSVGASPQTPHAMIELIQFPWSPYCLVQRRILEFAGVPHKVTNIPSNTDRSLVWKVTKQRYYQVPVLRDGKNVLFETGENSQV